MDAKGEHRSDRVLKQSFKRLRTQEAGIVSARLGWLFEIPIKSPIQDHRPSGDGSDASITCTVPPNHPHLS
jgi:hypothetical protein